MNKRNLWTPINRDWRDWKECSHHWTWGAEDDGEDYPCWALACYALKETVCCLEHALEMSSILGIDPPILEDATWWHTRYNRFPGVCSRCTNFGDWTLMERERIIARYCPECVHDAIQRMRLPPTPPSC